jgi:hypothetical protein
MRCIHHSTGMQHKDKTQLCWFWQGWPCPGWACLHCYSLSPRHQVPLQVLRKDIHKPRGLGFFFLVGFLHLSELSGKCKVGANHICDTSPRFKFSDWAEFLSHPFLSYNCYACKIGFKGRKHELQAGITQLTAAGPQDAGIIGDRWTAEAPGSIWLSRPGTPLLPTAILSHT